MLNKLNALKVSFLFILLLTSIYANDEIDENSEVCEDGEFDVPPKEFIPSIFSHCH